MNKIVIILINTLISTNVFALRCGNSLVYEGDTLAKVIQKCGAPESGYSNIFGDQGTLTYNNHDGSSSTVTILNNRVTNIEESRQ